MPWKQSRDHNSSQDQLSKPNAVLDQWCRPCEAVFLNTVLGPQKQRIRFGAKQPSPCQSRQAQLGVSNILVERRRSPWFCETRTGKKGGETNDAIKRLVSLFSR